MEGSSVCGAAAVPAPDRGEVHLCHCTLCDRRGGGFFVDHEPVFEQFAAEGGGTGEQS